MIKFFAFIVFPQGFENKGEVKNLLPADIYN